MGMETDRSPVIDPGAPSEQIYRRTNIPHSRAQVCKFCAGSLSPGARCCIGENRYSRDQIGGSRPIGVRVYLAADVRHEGRPVDGVPAWPRLAPREAGGCGGSAATRRGEALGGHAVRSRAMGRRFFLAARRCPSKVRKTSTGRSPRSTLWRCRGPPSWGTDRTRGRACPERVAAVSVQQRDECRAPTPIRAALRAPFTRPLVDRRGVLLAHRFCLLRAYGFVFVAVGAVHLHAREHCLHCWNARLPSP